MILRMSILGIVVIRSVVTSHAGTAGGERVTTTVYVSPHFEVRDRDQPVKYVFNGETRVARITGSLSANTRIQRWQLQAGWNLCGVAVDRATLPPAPEIIAAFQWNPVMKDYARVGTGQPLNAGSVVWVKVGTNVVTSLIGNHVEPESVPVGESGTYVSAGLEARPLQLPPGVTVWRYTGKTWQPAFANDLSSLNGPLPILAPGEAIYLHTDQPVELATPDPALRIRYYHQDHLGSSSVVTDSEGVLIEEAAFYPFGALRHEEQLREVEAHYQFTQKERDRESGLQDFGHRYYQPALARWLSPDPMGEKGGGLNLYAYVNQNPLKHVDPNGAEIRVTVDDKKNPTRYEITLKAVFIDSSSKKFSEAQMTQFANNLKSRIESSFQGKDGKISWVTKVDLRVVNGWNEVARDDHVFRIVDKAKGAGETTHGGMLMSIKTHRYTQKHPSEVDQTRPENKHYTLENYTSAEGTGTHEFGHAAGLHHDDRYPNLMQNGDVRKSDNTHVTLQQIQTIWKAHEANALNKREPLLDELTKSK
jgi:RHS repeat-associated protein